MSGPGLPLIVSVTEGSDGDGEGLPHWVQSVLHHFSLVADSKPGDQQRFKMLQEKKTGGAVKPSYIYPDRTEHCGSELDSLNLCSPFL